MATLSSLRDSLRMDVDDVQKLATSTQFTNEFLNEKLFKALQQHNKDLTWATLPAEEEQLVSLLAKSILASDLSLQYAISPKINVNANVRSKVENAELLRQISGELRDEYKETRNLISAQTSSGDVTEGILVRTSQTTRGRVPQQGASRPGKMQIRSVRYDYNALLSQGRIYFTWQKPRDYDLAFIKVMLSQRSPVTINDTLIRTMYDVYIDPLAIPPVPPIAEEEGYIDYTLASGTWYMALVPVNWNRLWSVSDSVEFEAVNYISCRVDALVAA